jgi:ABC-2 type transport system ATP-binding protein
MSSDVAIKVNHVNKTFKLPHEKQQVLKDISFEIKKGEFFGIVGRNGSGKSTLLKLLAGIYTPDSGIIQVNGKLTPFIELGVGFNPELTGRENVFLNGALLGFNRKEMLAMYDEIVEFAEIENFMDQKLKNYSSGMQVRLAFSIAIRAKSDILLIDEVLAVGDAAFQAKCFNIFAKLKDAGKTIILVTHDMSSVLRFCDRAMLINKGEVIDIGMPTEVADKYLELNYEVEVKETRDKEKAIIVAAVLSSEGKSKSIKTVRPRQKVKIEIELSKKRPEKIHLGMQLFNDAGNYCFGTNTKIFGLKTIDKSVRSVDIEIPSLDLLAGSYSVTLALMNESATEVIEYAPKMIEFRVTKESEFEGIMMIEHKWGTTNV